MISTLCGYAASFSAVTLGQPAQSVPVLISGNLVSLSKHNTVQCSQLKGSFGPGQLMASCSFNGDGCSKISWRNSEPHVSQKQFSLNAGALWFRGWRTDPERCHSRERGFWAVYALANPSDFDLEDGVEVVHTHCQGLNENTGQEKHN